MNILILSPFLPFPLDQGGKIRIFNLIKHLSARHKVTLAAIVDDPETADLGPLREMCDTVHLFHRPARLWPDRFAFFGGSAPYNVVRYRCAEMRRTLASLHQEKKFDVVQIEFTMMWQYADLFPSIPVVLDAHNIEYKNVQQIGSRATSRFWQLLYHLETRRLQKVEGRAWRECAACFTVSEKERAEIAAIPGCSGANIVTAANGVDPERFPFRVRTGRGEKILLLGGMDYTPNLDATGYFLSEIFPKIRAEVPEARVLLVGRELNRLRQLVAAPGIECHENVQDVVPWFYQADLLAVPLRQGAGTRIKVLEAMASGLPVVTTAKGCEGITVTSGSELLVSDSTEGFVAAVLEVMGDPSRAQKMAERASRLVNESYTWERAAETVSRTLQSLQMLPPPLKKG